MAIAVTCSHCGVRLRFKSEHEGKAAKCPSCDAPLLVRGESVPDHDVFISYSSKDKNVADAVCAALEARKLRCWIAPRDVLAGKAWAGAILDAISDARVMVLIYSASANTSPQVIREVDRAVTHNCMIVPFRIEAAAMSKEMEYYIGAAHWLDASDGPMDGNIGKLISTLQRLFAEKTTSGSSAIALPGSRGEDRIQPAQKNSSGAMAAVLIILILSAVGFAFFRFHAQGARPSHAGFASPPPPTPLVRESSGIAAPYIRHGKWRIDGDQLSFIHEGRTPSMGITFGAPDWSNYNFTFRVLPNGVRAFFVGFHVVDEGTFLQFAAGYINSATSIQACQHGTYTQLNMDTHRIEPDRWHEVRLEVRGHDYSCFIDHQKWFSGADSFFDQGRLRLCTMNGATRFSDFKVTSPDGKVLMSGFPDVSKLPPESRDTAPVPLPSDVRVVDLLKQVDPQKDTLLGEWKRLGSTLMSGKTEAQIQFPYTPSGEYDFRVEYERPEATNVLAMIVSWEGRVFAYVGGTSNMTTGWSLVDNRRLAQKHPTTTLNTGRRCVVLSLRKDIARAFVDGELWGFLRNDYQNVRLPPRAKKPDKPTLGFYTGGDAVIIHSAEVIEVHTNAADENDESPSQ